jgi:hypothetical protein
MRLMEHRTRKLSVLCVDRDGRAVVFFINAQGLWQTRQIRPPKNKIDAIL